MRNKTIMMMLSAAACMAMTCSAAAEETQPAENIFMRISQVNELDQLISKHGNLKLEESCYFADGTMASWNVYLDSSSYVFEEDGYLYYDRNYDVCIFDDQAKTAERMLFAGNCIDQYVAANESVGWVSYDPDLHFYANEEKDGLQVVTGIRDFKGDLEGIRSMGYSIETDSALLFTYYMDSSTLEVQKMTTGILQPDGSETKINEYVMHYDAEKYELPKEKQDAIYGKDYRSVTIIADPGTSAEKKYVQTVTKGSLISVTMENGYSLYDDKECTKPHTSDGDTKEDKVLYMKK